MEKKELRRQILSEATRDELIYELNQRPSITSIKVLQGNAATIKSMHGNIAVEGESNIFVIKANKKNTAAENSDVNLGGELEVGEKGTRISFGKIENETTIVKSHEKGTVFIDKKRNPSKSFLRNMKTTNLDTSDLAYYFSIFALIVSVFSLILKLSSK